MQIHAKLLIILVTTATLTCHCYRTPKHVFLKAMFFKSKISHETLAQKSDNELYNLLREEKRTARIAFSLLYDRHSTRVYSYCRRILQNPA
ncbi:MAG TPA: hypothetical protein VEC36_08555, partial [Patescibacteria group bacterium]|nr:hypothetical protein [Patescibacteria group bacterium]